MTSIPSKDLKESDAVAREILVYSYALSQNSPRIMFCAKIASIISYLFHEVKHPRRFFEIK